MAAGDVTPVWGASSDLTVTNLAGLAASATWVDGWESAEIDNAGFLDRSIEAEITVESSGLTAGEIRLYVVPLLTDGNYPDAFDGTESTESVTDTEMRDAICKLVGSTVTDTGASNVYTISVTSLAALLGALPAKMVLFITQSTVAALETSGQRVTIKGSYLNVAQ